MFIFFPKFPFFSFLFIGILGFLPFTQCFSWFFTWVLDRKGSPHISTCFQSTLYEEKLIYNMSPDSQKSFRGLPASWFDLFEVKWSAAGSTHGNVLPIGQFPDCAQDGGNHGGGALTVRTDLASEWTQVCINLSLIDGNKRWIEAAQCLSLCECVIWILTVYKVNGLCDTVFPSASALISPEKNI